MHSIIAYGKGQVTLYRTYARPLSGITPIPESSFTGRRNILFAVDVDVEVLGDNFLPAYTEGDNTNVVATDSMKNFVHGEAIAYEGSTIEGFLATLGLRFLGTYPHMHHLRLSGREQPFAPAQVPSGDSGMFTDSEVLFSRRHDEHGVAMVEIRRDGQDAHIADHRCGCTGLQLIKVTGSSFTHFVRDEHTTLPEAVDRPLFIYLDVYWKYAHVEQLVGPATAHYVAPEQVRDLVQVTFHRFVSKSIQHLVYEMGIRLLRRFPQLAEVSFDAQNRLWDTAAVSQADPRIKSYCDPRPPYGMIHLTLARDSMDSLSSPAQAAATGA